MVLEPLDKDQIEICMLTLVFSVTNLPVTAVVLCYKQILQLLCSRPTTTLPTPMSFGLKCKTKIYIVTLWSCFQHYCISHNDLCLVMVV